MTNADSKSPSASAVALRMVGISKRFGPVQALEDVTFRLKTGTIHALVGENGAGKSTLMKILAGAEQPDTGSIELHGKTCRFTSPKDALAAGVAMIYQELDLADHLTVAENVFLANEPKGRFPFTIDRHAMAAETARLARRFNFDIDPDALVAELPTAKRQIVEILKALARNTTIVVMDEPTASLAEEQVHHLFDILRQLRENDISIVYISHRLEEITGLADEVTVLRDGRVVHSEPIEYLDIPKIVRFMVGRELNQFFPKRHAKIGPTLVKVSNLSQPPQVSGVSFEIRRGQIVGLAGLVGAGRTTLARSIFAVTPPATGIVLLNDQPLRLNSPADAIAAGIAYLTEDRKRTGLFPQLPCTWNITLPSLASIGMKSIIHPTRENKIAADIARRIAIRPVAPDAPASALSGGNQQKLLIARWLLADSRFLIFDEPTRGIDVGAKKEVYELLNALAEQGKAILLISSELPELFGIADRILVMRRGRLVADLTTDQTSPEEIMHLAAVEEN